MSWDRFISGTKKPNQREDFFIYKGASMRKISEIMSTNIISALPETSLIEISKLMVKHNCGEIPLVNNMNQQIVVGIITDRDIVCRTLGQGKNPMELSARDCMTTQVVMADVSMSVSDVIILMRDNKIRRIPVVDKDDKLTGLISQTDILQSSNDKEVVQMVHELSNAIDSPPSVIH
jgi:CBS domain-containing protein